jgi:peptidoglycan-associated lipoprotein
MEIKSTIWMLHHTFKNKFYNDEKKLILRVIAFNKLNMRIIKFVIILLPAVFISFSIKAQALRKANATYEAGEYQKAIELFKDAYEKLEDKAKKTEVIFKISDCYRHMNDAQHAELWFKKTIDRDYQNPLIYVYYADALRMQGKYKDAEPNYRKFKELVPDDPRGENGIQSCQMAQKWIDNPNGYQVEDMKFLNSKADDYSPAYGRNDYMVVYFTSCREGSKGKETHGATGQLYADIYVSKQDRKDKWSTPVPLGEEINTESEEGAPCFNKNFTIMYYTVCKFSKNKKNGCQIFSSQLNGETFSKGSALEIAGTGDSLVIAHPALSTDENTLYFSSDMPGGLGGKDIWKTTKTDGKWGKPENMGNEINTPGDEMFPYIHPDGTLYYSSNGMIGLGGLDIYKAKLQADGHWKVENMRSPINSAADDFGITFQADQEKGFLSSTRNGRDDDIFTFVLPPLKFNISGLVKDEKSKQILTDANIKCIGSDGITTDLKSGNDGSFKTILKPNTDYVFIASHEGFLNNKQRETTKGESKSKDFKIELLLTSIKRTIEIPNIFWDFGSSTLRPESMVALDKLIEILNDNPNVTIELGSHTDYIGNENINLDISQKRAQSVVNYLIEKGIADDRMIAKGYGKTKPKEADEKVNTQFSFIPIGTILNETFIKTLTPDQQEFTNQINRRTEFRVLRTDYIPKK